MVLALTKIQNYDIKNSSNIKIPQFPQQKIYGIFIFDFMKKIYVITGNEAKLRDFKKVLSPEIEIVSERLELFEPQTIDQYEIISHKAREAYTKMQHALCVDDFGLYISRYNNFPGALTKYIFKTLGYQGIFSLTEDGEPAFYKTIVGFIDQSGIKYFAGVIHGRLTHILPKQFDKDTPLNSIFVPEGQDKTFAELCTQENFKSHRAIALEKLKKFLLQIT